MLFLCNSSILWKKTSPLEVFGMRKSNEQIAMNVSWVSIFGNVILSVFKFLAGIIANSGAMVSDAVHSSSDILSTFIVIIAVKISNKENDIEHPYGHERFECVAAIILAIILGFIGIGIGYVGVLKILSANNSELAIPGTLALLAAVISIIVKEAMYWYTRLAAIKIDSSALMADAWHHRSDALSSIGSFLGILGARLGFPVLDPIASLIICIYIVNVAVKISTNSINKMVDKSCDDTIIAEMKTIIAAQDGVLSIDQIKTRLFGAKIYVDIEIGANGSDSLAATHDIAQRIHDAIEGHFEKVKHCMVHVNPVENNKSTTVNIPPSIRTNSCR
jgi:cation diffusion facilitator family transporter